MFFVKPLGARTAKKCNARLNLSLSCKNADFLRCVNVKSVGNGLRHCGRMEQIGFEPTAIKVLYELDGMLYVLAQDGVYVYADGQATLLLNKSSANGTCIEYNRKLIYSADGVGIYQLTKTDSQRLWVYGYNSMAISGDRIVLVNDFEVNFGPAGVIDNWMDEQRITTHDKCRAVVALGTKLYALGETCYVFEPSAEGIDVKFYPFAHNIGDVVANTVVTFGKKAVFATNDGLRVLSSGSVSHLFDELNDYVSFVGATACEYNGKYYVSCKCKDGEQTRNDVTLVLDVDSASIVGVLTGYEMLYSKGDHLYAVNSGRVYKLTEDSDFGSFCVTGVDMGNFDTKYLDQLVIKTKRDADVCIQTDVDKRTYSVKGANCLQKLPLTGVGREFSVEISSSDGIALERVELVAHRYEV